MQCFANCNQPVVFNFVASKVVSQIGLITAHKVVWVL